MKKKEWNEEERKAIEAKFRAEFTAEDLARYADEDELIPFEQVIREVEAQQHQLDQQSHEQP